jgi:hypothetical protein
MFCSTSLWANFLSILSYMKYISSRGNYFLGLKKSVA